MGNYSSKFICNSWDALAYRWKLDTENIFNEDLMVEICDYAKNHLDEEITQDIKDYILMKMYEKEPEAICLFEALIKINDPAIFRKYFSTFFLNGLI